MEQAIFALLAFLATAILILWRPGGAHEAVYALGGALLVMVLGLVGLTDVIRVTGIVWNAAMTIISTFIMAAVLEGSGFFHWVARRLAERAQGSSRKLLPLSSAFSAFLTLFLNNDGSILIGTPIIVSLVQQMRLREGAAKAILIAACLMASAASAPIAVSNMANLEAMAILDVSLLDHFRYVTAPALLGLTACWVALLFRFRGRLPNRPMGRRSARPHAGSGLSDPVQVHVKFMWFAVSVVVAARLGVFLSTPLGIPTYWITTAGAALLLLANTLHRVADAGTTLRRAPWAILAFAMGMDLVVFGLKNAGITRIIADLITPAVRDGGEWAAAVPGLLTAGVAALLNNHPGLIIGSLSLSEIHGISAHTFRLAYAGIILGSDIGALLTPVGTLASLLWFHLIRERGLKCSWLEYVRVTLFVIPLSFAAALLGTLLIGVLLSP